MYIFRINLRLAVFNTDKNVSTVAKRNADKIICLPFKRRCCEEHILCVLTYCLHSKMFFFAFSLRLAFLLFNVHFNQIYFSCFILSIQIGDQRKIQKIELNQIVQIEE